MANWSIDLSPIAQVWDWMEQKQKQRDADKALQNLAGIVQAGDVVTQQKTDAQPAWTPQAPTQDFLSASLMQQQPAMSQVPTPQQYNVTETRTPYQQSPKYKEALWNLAKYYPNIMGKLVMPDKDENLHFVTNPNAEGGYTAVNPKTGKPVYKEAGTPIPKKPQEQLAERELANKQENDKWTQTINQLIAQYENPNTSKEMLPGIKQYVRENFGEHPVAAKWLADVEKDKSVTGAQTDQKYIDIQTRLKTDPKSVTNEEMAWASGYEKTKTLAPNAYGGWRLRIMNESPMVVVDDEGKSRITTKEEAKNTPGLTTPVASVPLTEQKAAAKQRYGTRAANVSTASGMYAKEAPEIKRLRAKVQAKGLLPTFGFTDMNTLNQWLGRKWSDPDMVELSKKVKFLADSLQRTIGGTQGGEWAFEVAADILNPSYSPEAFNRVVDSHGKAMKRMADEYKNFGKELSKTESKTDPLGIR